MSGDLEVVGAIKSLTIVLEEMVNQMSLLRGELYLQRLVKEKQYCVKNELGSYENPYPAQFDGVQIEKEIVN